MSKKSVECIENIYTLKNIWNSIAEQDPTNSVFLTFEWLSCWLNVYAPNVNSFIICVRENDSIIALAPFIIVSHSEFGIPLKRLQFIGHLNSDYMDFLILKDQNECINLILDYIYNQQVKWDYCVLSHFSGESGNLLLLESILSKRNNIFKKLKGSICPYIKIQSDIETFLKQKKSGLRYDLKKSEIELRKKGELSYTKITDQSCALIDLPQFLEMLDKRENQVNRIGTKQNNEFRKQNFELFINDESMWPNINFCKLCIDNKPIAYHLGFEYNYKIYWYKPTFDVDFIKYSPGKLLIKKSLEYAIKNEFNEFDFLLGDEPYKFQWSDKFRDSYDIIFANQKLFSKLISYWFISIRPSLKIIKYKIFGFKKSSK